MKLFMSKAQKAMRAKMAIRRGVQELKVWNRNLEKKKAEMIGYAQTAKMHGIPAQYALAISGLKMILTQQKRAMSMTLQMQLVETMRDLSTMSSGFVKLIGSVGKEISKITGKVDFFKNQEAFQEGMMSMDGLMMQMESFLETNAEPMQDVAGTDEISDSDIEKLIDVTASAGEDKVESEIEKKLEEVKRSLNA